MPAGDGPKTRSFCTADTAYLKANYQEVLLQLHLPFQLTDQDGLHRQIVGQLVAAGRNNGAVEDVVSGVREANVRSVLDVKASTDALASNLNTATRSLIRSKGMLHGMLVSQPQGGQHHRHQLLCMRSAH